MKSIASAAAFFSLTVLLIGGVPLSAYAGGAMLGRDPTYAPGGAKGVSHGGTGGGGGTCSGAVQRCKKAFPTSAAACASAERVSKPVPLPTPRDKPFPG